MEQCYLTNPTLDTILSFGCMVVEPLELLFSLMLICLPIAVILAASYHKMRQTRTVGIKRSSSRLHPGYNTYLN